MSRHAPRVLLRSVLLGAVLLGAVLAATGCATLPDTDALRVRHRGQQTQFENALGPLSSGRSAARTRAERAGRIFFMGRGG